MRDPSSSLLKGILAVASLLSSKSSNRTFLNLPYLTNLSLNGKTLVNIKISTFSDSTTRILKGGDSLFKFMPL